MTTPSKVLSGDTKLRNTFSANHLHGRLQPVGHIERPQNPLHEARPPSADHTTKHKPMGNTPLTLLGRLNRASKERKLHRAEYGRELLAAPRAAKRAVLKAQRSRHAAEDAYSAQACKVLNRSAIVVHNEVEIIALLELLGEARPPYGLRRVDVRGSVGNSVDPIVQHMRENLEARMRENLEANGFELREWNSYAPPQQQGNTQKVDQKTNKRWEEVEEEDDESADDDDDEE